MINTEIPKNSSSIPLELSLDKLSQFIGYEIGTEVLYSINGDIIESLKTGDYHKQSGENISFYLNEITSLNELYKLSIKNLYIDPVSHLLSRGYYLSDINNEDNERCLRTKVRLMKAVKNMFPCICFQTKNYVSKDGSAKKIGKRRMVILRNDIFCLNDEQKILFIILHEIGHHLGGAPFSSLAEWRSCESQSDYWAAKNIIRFFPNIDFEQLGEKLKNYFANSFIPHNLKAIFISHKDGKEYNDSCNHPSPKEREDIISSIGGAYGGCFELGDKHIDCNKLPKCI